MTIQSIKVLLLFKMRIIIITPNLILLVNAHNSMTREDLFLVIMNKVDIDIHHFNRFREAPPTKLVLVQLGNTNSRQHHVVSLTLLPSLILINHLLPFIIKHVMR